MQDSKTIGSCGLFHVERREDTDGAAASGVDNVLLSDRLSDEAEGLEKLKDRLKNMGLGRHVRGGALLRY